VGSFKRNYGDVERREAGEGYAGDPPKPGIYEARLVSCKEHLSTAGNEGTEWVFEVTEEPYAGWRGWVYTNDSTAAWKEVQILEAVGILAPGKDDLNTTHEKILAKAKPCRVKVKNETYEGEKKGKVTVILPPKADSKAKGSDDDDDSDDDPF
jgi:hypothetical protein